MRIPLSIYLSTIWIITTISFIVRAAVVMAHDGVVPADPAAISDWRFWVELIKISPAIFSLMLVIFLLYRIILAKDATLTAMVRATEADIERQSKILTLLETLVQVRINGGPK